MLVLFGILIYKDSLLSNVKMIRFKIEKVRVKLKVFLLDVIDFSNEDVVYELMKRLYELFGVLDKIYF